MDGHHGSLVRLVTGGELAVMDFPPDKVGTVNLANLEAIKIKSSRKIIAGKSIIGVVEMKGIGVVICFFSDGKVHFLNEKLTDHERIQDIELEGIPHGF